MPNKLPERVTYAQQKLLSLVEQRKLRSWCFDNGLEHSNVYQVAVGHFPPNFKLISATSHLIPPVEWFFFSDEKLPFEPCVCPKWDISKESVFVARYKKNPSEIAAKYGVSKSIAQNICAGRTKPTIAFIRACCKDTNPLDFFTEAEESGRSAASGKYAPDRGDIVNVRGSLLFVLTNSGFAKQRKSVVACPIVSSCEGGVELKSLNTKGFVKTDAVMTHSISSNATFPHFFETADEATVEKVMSSVRKIFE